MKGGVAKTTLATNLADVLVREDCNILLVDLDPQFNATQCLVSGEEYVVGISKGQSTIVAIFDDAPPAIVSAVNPNRSQAKTELKDIKPWNIKRGFDLVPGDLELYRLEMGGGHGREQRLKRYLEAINAKDIYDFVIIDTPPTPSHWMMAALLASDGYLVPVKPEPLSRTGDLLRGVVERCSQNFGHPIECWASCLLLLKPIQSYSGKPNSF
jgi:chromosome partitioning protein